MLTDTTPGGTVQAWGVSVFCTFGVRFWGVIEHEAKAGVPFSLEAAVPAWCPGSQEEPPRQAYARRVPGMSLDVPSLLEMVYGVVGVVIGWLVKEFSGKR